MTFTSDRLEPGASGPITFLDLAALHSPLREDLDKAWNETLNNSSFVGSETIREFERAWAKYCGTEQCVGVANGTDALELTLTGLGVGPGDEVIVPANTFVATAAAVVTVGATPVFVDVDQASLLITAEQISNAITRATRAVLVVHLFGQIPNMDAILAITDRAGIHLVEDAAQAHGAASQDRTAGSFGIAATFSFHPGKNLGGLGDGGAVVTNDEALATEIRTLANHGRANHLLHTHRGRNSRLDGLQAAALSIKLNHLDRWNQRRRLIHQRYEERLADSVDMVQTLPGSNPVHHLEVIRVADRDGLRAELGQREIQSGIHYALPCHKHPAFAEFDVMPLPVAEAAAKTQLSLPMHPTLTVNDVDAVAEVVLQFVGSPSGQVSGFGSCGSCSDD